MGRVRRLSIAGGRRRLRPHSCLQTVSSVVCQATEEPSSYQPSSSRAGSHSARQAATRLSARNTPRIRSTTRFPLIGRRGWRPTLTAAIGVSAVVESSDAPGPAGARPVFCRPPDACNIGCSRSRATASKPFAASVSDGIRPAGATGSTSSRSRSAASSVGGSTAPVASTGGSAGADTAASIVRRAAGTEWPSSTPRASVVLFNASGPAPASSTTGAFKVPARSARVQSGPAAGTSRPGAPVTRTSPCVRVRALTRRATSSSPSGSASPAVSSTVVATCAASCPAAPGAGGARVTTATRTQEAAASVSAAFSQRTPAVVGARSHGPPAGHSWPSGVLAAVPTCDPPPHHARTTRTAAVSEAPVPGQRPQPSRAPASGTGFHEPPAPPCARFWNRLESVPAGFSPGVRSTPG